MVYYATLSCFDIMGFETLNLNSCELMSWALALLGISIAEVVTLAFAALPKPVPQIGIS